MFLVFSWLFTLYEKRHTKKTTKTFGHYICFANQH